eukprot:m.19609 g.19609  ORF g.19609 m.19609 type:complete len:641 (+) comp10393_c0_seq1:224-2146(+)
MAMHEEEGSSQRFDALFEEGRKDYVSKWNLDMPCVIVVGATGAGKSTLIAKLIGQKVTFKKKLGGKKAVVEPNGIAGPEIFNGTASGTVFPYSFKMQGQNIFLFDTPGHLDTRGPTLEDLTSMFRQYLLSKSKALMGFIAVLQDDVSDRGTNIRKALDSLAVYAVDYDKLNILFVFTASKRTVKNICAEMQELHNAYTKELAGPEKDPRKELQREFLGFMLRNPRSIIVYDDQMALSEFDVINTWKPVDKSLLSNTIHAHTVEALSGRFDRERSLLRNLDTVKSTMEKLRAHEEHVKHNQSTVDELSANVRWARVKMNSLGEQAETLAQSIEAAAKRFNQAKMRLPEVKGQVKKELEACQQIIAAQKTAKKDADDIREVLKWDPYPVSKTGILYTQSARFEYSLGYPISSYYYDYDPSCCTKSYESVDKPAARLVVRFESGRNWWGKAKNLRVGVRVYVAYCNLPEAKAKKQAAIDSIAAQTSIGNTWQQLQDQAEQELTMAATALARLERNKLQLSQEDANRELHILQDELKRKQSELEKAIEARSQLLAELEKLQQSSSLEIDDSMAFRLEMAELIQKIQVENQKEDVYRAQGTAKSQQNTQEYNEEFLETIHRIRAESAIACKLLEETLKKYRAPRD